MNIQKHSRAAFFVILSILFSVSIISAQTQEEYQKRQQAVIEKMEPNSVLILRGNGAAGEFRPFRQENNFYYLTGLNEPGASLILRAPRGGRTGLNESRAAGVYPGSQAGRGTGSATLFISRRSGRVDWDPQTLGLEGAREQLGFQDVKPSQDFQSEFERVLVSRPSVIYMDYERSRGLHSPLTPDEDLFKKARDKGAAFEIKSASTMINPLRGIKSQAEIKLLQTAIDITAEAQKEAVRSIQPGMYEYQLQSIIEYVFSFNEAKRPGFSSIVGSGPNSCILHWSENSRKMEDGDLVVIDIGAEYNMYTADVTRTIPVNGKFTQRQKDIYEIVLATNEGAIAMIAPGVSMRDVSNKASEILAEGLIKVGLIKDRSELRTYYFHGLSHPIGLQVHDVGRTGVLEPGMVITIEPGIYIREEGLGVRIEDDVLVTETGHEVMSKNAPKTVAEIEALAKEKGMDYSRYLIKKKP